MNEDVRISQILGMSVLEYHDILERMERLDPRDLNAIAMQLINRSIIKLEQSRVDKSQRVRPEQS